MIWSRDWLIDWSTHIEQPNPPALPPAPQLIYLRKLQQESSNWTFTKYRCLHHEDIESRCITEYCTSLTAFLEYFHVGVLAKSHSGHEQKVSGEVESANLEHQFYIRAYLCESGLVVSSPVF